MTITTHRYTPTDPRLGRHVKHDSRSAAYAVGVMPKSAIRSVEWPRHIPILDQANLGSCVPNNAPEHLGTDALGYTGVSSVVIPKADTKGEFTAGSLWPLAEPFAVNLYRLLTRLDSYPGQWEPDDTGSDGLTLAKALVMLGFSDKYQHAFSYAAVVSALQAGPVSLGIEWENSMYTPGADGKITIDYSSGVAGGHEIFVRKFDADNDRVWVDNSWSESWGLDGRAWFQGSELATLLKRQGDVTVPHLIGAAPIPTPTGITAQAFYDQVKAAAATAGLK
ncbi:hypothetical protein [Streptomyces sp. OK228]|uniref:hypothetical protein n=1 Tax=Streptomyces sp. OK228 TaxID=1882786 RepID=UPI000BCE6A84|nr:hypothetical protein [Streptomyces sp. OK228]SOE25628.1 hypothetical protein SAMN05442782_2370 [Streptomyces sp. OK228]